MTGGEAVKSTINWCICLLKSRIKYCLVADNNGQVQTIYDKGHLR